MRTVDANKHYNFETSGVAWHLESDGAAWLRRYYVTLVPPEARRRVAAGFEDELPAESRT